MNKNSVRGRRLGSVNDRMSKLVSHNVYKDVGLLVTVLALKMRLTSELDGSGGGQGESKTKAKAKACTMANAKGVVVSTPSKYSCRWILVALLGDGFGHLHLRVKHVR